MIRDSEFISTPNVPGPTKEEVRCLVLCKSQIKKEDIVVDVGCGTGGLTLGFAKIAKKVYSIDKNPEAIEITQKNLIKHELIHKVKLIGSDAVSAIVDMEKFDVLMIGGSGGDLHEIIHLSIPKLKKGGRIIVTAILMETKMEAIQTFNELSIGFEIIEVNVSKGKIIDRGTMMFAQNPIAIIYTI
ncbi:precorrin-6Y C5,15-methyltransferase (decarboxylating) subunit CbiT [Methanobacterium alcaliphilum]|uniref:precorrin-6Y C5,15-methyltransferase (decarboxylating) subunit CbiT n=1 Tax=Methanobacterium alcaliphilum TaxID=392018 RepID=UPI00200B5329|nr:precorrin-6Y C5,15-methyltransferase (decarboxylating) subunit CbiT [Methanobacterium alcaliphilum]MCK9151659.1 precorrin-6Y C5,15-methyltransferase (decarboxylating) subunit CbiT [Methanobacterium alcaliphilum]